MHTPQDRAARMVERFPLLMKMFHRVGPGALADVAITLSQYHTLAAFAFNPEWTLTDLADFLNVRPPAASELVEKLVKANFLKRETNPADRRQTILTLTGDGEAFMAERKSQLIETYSKLLQRLAPEDQASLESALAELVRISHLLQQMDEGK